MMPESISTASEETAIATQHISKHAPAVTSTHAEKFLGGGQQGDRISLNFFFQNMGSRLKY
jgi:hypothetical protein